MLGVDEDDPTLRNLHRHLKLPDDVPNRRRIADGPHASVHEQMKLADVNALELEGEADGGRVVACASPVGDPPIDLQASSVPERCELGHPELGAEGADRIQGVSVGGEHGPDRMRMP